MDKVCTLRRNIIIVRLNGDLDHHVTEQIRNEIDESISTYNVYNVAFDFRDVNFMDSSGIGLLMGRYKKIRPAGGNIYVSNLNCQVQRIFGLFGLESIVRRNASIDAIVNEEDTYEQN